MSIDEEIECIVQDKVVQYSDEKVPDMLVDFCIEKYIDRRCYPNSYTEDKIVADLKAHVNTIAMAAIDIQSKVGGEGEIYHSENGIIRQYENAFISKSIYGDIYPFAGSVI